MDSVQYWLFDLDNTLYPPHLNIIEAYRDIFVAFLQKKCALPAFQANEIYHNLHTHTNQTLADLSANHNITLYDLLYTMTDINLDHVKENQQLKQLIHQLPGKKYVFTNALDLYAEKILKKLGLLEIFDDIYAISQSQTFLKPDMRTYKKIIDLYKINPHQAIFFEDTLQNLVPARQLGMKTVYVNYLLKDEKPSYEYVDYTTSCLVDFLTSFNQYRIL